MNALPSDIALRKHLNSTSILALILISLNLIVYFQVYDHDFIIVDDSIYVTKNPMVQRGLTWESIRWAFTNGYANIWHPLVWLSLQMDYELFGLDAGKYHLTNLVFHILSTLLLFHVFKMMTGSPRRSGLVAALFAIHPLHVESVAWVAERKDVLSGFFWMLVLWSYLQYRRNPGKLSYGIVLLFLALGLMAKPMLVTIPFVLLLLDFWPLGLIFNPQERASGRNASIRKAMPFVWEKVPMLAICAFFSAIAYITQSQGGALNSLDNFPMGVRVANAVVSYTAYLGKTILPLDLSIYYPHPGMPSFWQLAGSIMLVLTISFVAWCLIRRAPYLIVGWCWYLGTLVPVIGIVQIGSFAMADRFTYIPLLGIFILVVWGGADLVNRFFSKSKSAFQVAAVLTVLAFAYMAHGQTRYWENSLMLLKHALHLDAGSWYANHNLGNAYLKENKPEKAIEFTQKALKLCPSSADIHNTHGYALLLMGKTDPSLHHFTEAIRLRPDHADALNNLGLIRLRQGHIDDAISLFERSLKADPYYVEACNNLGNALSQKGNIAGAMRFYAKAIQINPGFEEAYYNLGTAYLNRKMNQPAIAFLSTATKLNPKYAKAHNNLAAAYLAAGHIDQAIDHLQTVVSLEPHSASAVNNLKKVLAIQPNRIK